MGLRWAQEVQKWPTWAGRRTLPGAGNQATGLASLTIERAALVIKRWCRVTFSARIAATDLDHAATQVVKPDLALPPFPQPSGRG